ncbi:2-hydroxyacyl-CoA dehydratase subunit D [Nocardia jiangxiensis]|uniref:2-hydroxyacyl-CoA dehydratase subunit D n=1 Tax=Nocardia jiangxiensis TaxID=282685 RepID=A0ABW6S8P7_9NOCA|nr:2-hydroxyacyl-CoA dehydratase family protein [Nocardia jiangxiensis]
MYEAKSAISTLVEVAADPDAYVAAWKARTGRPVVGAFPMNFPAEIAHAAGALPVIIQESRETITVGRNLLTEFYCGYTRSVADQAAKGRLQVYDGFFLADHCIQLLGAVDVTREFEPDKPMYFGQFMSSMGEPWTPEQVHSKMAEFLSKMETFAGKRITDEDLRASIRLFDTGRQLLRRLYDARRDGDANFTASQLQAFIKSSMIMDRAEHNELLNRIVREHVVPVERDERVRLHLSGHFCHAPRTELLDLIEECGALVVDDDLFHGMRYISTDVGAQGDPIDALSQWYLRRNVSVPCPTRVQHDVDWDAYLLDAIDRSGAEGVIVLMAKFCEPHMLFYPELRKALDRRGIPHLLIETEHEGLPVESIRTRLEALLERIRRHRLAPVQV